MSATRKDFSGNIWCDAASDLPAAGQFVGQIAWINDATAAVKRWDGAAWIDVTPSLGGGTGTGGALTVLGRAVNSSGTRADIAASANGQFLQRTADTLVFANVTPTDTGIDPLTLSPYFYLSADSGVYKDAGVTLAANGDTVQQWNDLSGNGRHFSQSTAANRPTYRTNTLNSLPALEWDGSDDCLQRASVAITSFTIIVLFRNSSGSKLIYEHGPDINSNDGCALFSTSGNTISVKKGGVLSAANTDAGWGQTGHWMLVTQMYQTEGTDARHQLIVNSIYGAPANVSTGNPGVGTVTDTFNLGARNGGSAASVLGHITTCLCFTPAITYNQWRGVYLYLQNKWNI